MESRRTRSQKKILHFLKHINRGISAQGIHQEMRQSQQNIGLATVYRSLEALKLEGLVQVRQLPNGESLYNLAHTDQHHLTCVNCGRSILIEQCPVHELQHQLQESHNFKVYYHTLEFFGLCDRCA